MRTAAGGRGTTLLLRGDAGIGKTRLAEELLREAAEAGWTTLRGAVREEEGSLPYGPSPRRSTACCSSARTSRWRFPSGLVPGWRRSSPQYRSRARNLQCRRGRLQVFSAVTQLLAAAARERGGALLVDDVHAADAATLQLLHHVGRAARFHRILLLIAFREPAGEALARLRTALVDQRAATEVELAPLTAGESAEMLAQLAGRKLPAATVEAVYCVAEGNPFFIEELAAVAGERIVDVPSHLYDVVESRLARLNVPARAALETVAVAAGDVDADELIALCGLSEDEAFAVLDAALAARVLVEREGRYRFRHGLLRAALVRELPPHRRAAAHRDAAERLAGAGAPAARVAHQLLEAGLGERAVSWLARAAQEAAAVGAFADAYTLAARALEHAPEDPELIELRADLAVALGDPDAAGAYARALAAALGSSGDLFEASMLSAFATLNRGEWPERLRSDLLDPTRAPELAGMLHDAHLCVAEVYLYGGLPYQQVIAGARELAAAAERAGARRGIAFATTLLGEAELLSGRLDAARGHLGEGVRLNRQVGAHGGEALCLERLAELAGGDEVGARRLLAEAASWFAAAGQPLDAERCRDAVRAPAVAG